MDNFEQKWIFENKVFLLVELATVLPRQKGLLSWSSDWREPRRPEQEMIRSAVSPIPKKKYYSFIFNTV